MSLIIYRTYSTEIINAFATTERKLIKSPIDNIVFKITGRL